MFFVFILGALAMLAFAVFAPTPFSKMVSSIRSLWDKANSPDDGDDFSGN